MPFGSYRAGGGNTGPTVDVSVRSDAAEPATDGEFAIALSEASATDLVLTYTLSGSGTEGLDYVDTGGGSLTIAAGGTSTVLLLTTLDDQLIEGSETVEFVFGSLSDSTYSAGPGATLTISDDDLGSATIGIHLVQGSGETSPLAGNVVTVEGIVTGDFVDGLGGFYLQEEDSDVDQDSTTSEGIFVFAPDAEVSVGDRVSVTAEVEERFGQTQLRGGDAGASITVEAGGASLPTPRALQLPRADSLLEYLEGMLVAPEDLVITDVGSLARFGELGVTSGERLIQYTECNRPDAAGLGAYLDSIGRDQLVIDDGSSQRDPSPLRLVNGDTLSAGSQVRAGQTIAGLTGVLGFGFNRYRLQPTETAGLTLSGNDRPTAAPTVGGTLKVVSANVLNYFTTLASRGADTQEEFVRQEDKIVAALTELDADIVGLIEIENNGNAALARLTQVLSDRSGKPYAFVSSPNTGDDQIKVALIYRSDRVAESGTAAALAEPAGLFIGRNTNRVPLVQTFRIIDTGAGSVGEQLTVCVNHLKSKGGGCGAGDDDDGGAGNCNGTRTDGARAIVDWLATDPTGTGENDVMIIGDLNAYRMEDPIRVFEEAGYLNTKTRNGSQGSFPCGGGPPSYVFGGQWGKPRLRPGQPLPRRPGDRCHRLDGERPRARGTRLQY